MAYPFLTPVNTVLNVAAGGTATIQVDPTGTFYGLRPYYTRTGVAATPAEIASDIKQVRVYLDSNTQWELTGAQLQAINKAHGINPSDGEIPLWFTEPWRTTEAAEDLKAWGMLGISQFSVEIDIDAAATNPGLTCLQYKTPNPAQLGEIRKFKRQTVQVSGTGDLVIPNLTRNERQLALHCNTTNISNIKVKVAEIEQLNMSPTRLHSIAAEQGYIPQTGWTHIAFDHRNRILESLDPFILQQNGTFPPRAPLAWDVTLNMSVAANFVMVKELMGPRD